MYKLVVILMAASAGVQQPSTSLPATSSAVSGQTAEITSRQLTQLLDQLAHPRFVVRKSATRQLANLDISYLPELARRCRTETGFESKRRLRYIIEHIFHRNQIIGREGFLGVRIYQNTLSELTDPTSGKLVHGVAIVGVLDGFAAQRAGLKGKDVIISINGQPVPTEPTSAAFIQSIASYPPGSKLSLRILRTSDILRTTKVPVSQDPSQTFEGLTCESSPQGPRIVRIDAGSPAAALGLKANEIIHSINGRRCSRNNPQHSLNYALKEAKPGSSLTLTVVEIKELLLNLNLGARPVQLIPPADLLEAKSRFLKWWQNVGGELLLRSPDQQATSNYPLPAKSSAGQTAILP